VRPHPDVVHVRVGVAVLDQQIGHAINRQRSYLPNIGGIVQYTGGNDLIELKGLIDELEGGNQHDIKVSRFTAQINSLGKTWLLRPSH
jgi:hypothetical protein